MSSCRCKWPVIIDKSPLHQTIIRIIDSSALARTIKSLIRRSWYNSPGSSLYVDCTLMLHPLNTKHLHAMNAPTPWLHKEKSFSSPAEKPQLSDANDVWDEEGGWEDAPTCGSAHCFLIVNLPAEVMPAGSTTVSQWMPPTTRKIKSCFLHVSRPTPTLCHWTHLKRNQRRLSPVWSGGPRERGCDPIWIIADNQATC